MITNDDAHLPEDELIAAAEGRALSADVQRHIDSCAACTREVLHMRQTVSLLKEAPSPSLSPALRRDLVRLYRSRRLKRRPFWSVLSWKIPVYQAACLVAGAILAWEVVTPHSEARGQHTELLEELPTFTAAMSELMVGQYWVDANVPEASASRRQDRPVSGEVGPGRDQPAQLSPSREQTPHVDSCDVQAG